MAVKSLICSPSQIQAIRNGASEIWIPLTARHCVANRAGISDIFNTPDIDSGLVPPFAPGTRVACKEPWAVVSNTYGSAVVYRAGGRRLIGGFTGNRARGDYREFLLGEGSTDGMVFLDPSDWRSARHMPAEYVRTFFLAGASEPRKLDTMTPAEAYACGFSDHEGKGPYLSAFGGTRVVNNAAAAWHARYPKVPWSSYAWRISIEVTK